MQYLEDYLESIKDFPQEVKKTFKDIKKYDLRVQNTMSKLETRQKDFFYECSQYANKLPSSLEAKYKAIRKAYEKPERDADKKVHLAEQIFESADQLLRRLDRELLKTKCKLEAENKGITKVLEKRALENDYAPSLMNVSSQSEEDLEEESTDDLNKSRYCVCHQVPFGDMIACDNQDCPIEWFHYECVQITAAPEGEWYCPQCWASMERR